MRDELSVLSAFLTVAEERSFTRAAKRSRLAGHSACHCRRALVFQVTPHALVAARPRIEQWPLLTLSQSFQYLSYGTLRGADRARHEAGFRRARFASADRQALLPDACDPWCRGRVWMSGGSSIVGRCGQGIGCPVFEEGGPRVQRLRAIEASQLLQAGFRKGGFSEGRAHVSTDTQEPKQRRLTRRRCRIVNFTERADEALRRP
jgi:hypothetical protein